MLLRMGAFFVNYQIKSQDQQAVVATVSELVQSRAYVSPQLNGWITVYDETSETQDAYEIGRLGSELAAKLQTVVFAFLVNDSTLFVYYLFDQGDLLDEYSSAPVPANQAAEEDQKNRFQGRPEILMNYCQAGTLRRDVEGALVRGDKLIEGGFASSVQAEERLRGLAAILQIDDVRASTGFIDFDSRPSMVPEGQAFLKVDVKRMRRPAIRRIPPRFPPPPVR